MYSNPALDPFSPTWQHKYPPKSSVQFQDPFSVLPQNRTQPNLQIPPLMETQCISSFQFPPGVRFHPSDEELIVYYLHNKVKSRPLPAAVVAEIELYSHDPWDLPKKALFGDEEWYFFSPRDRKYPNGARPNRTAASGYWKATGTDKPILSSSGARIGVKKALVFYIGKPPNGMKTDWIMIEYRLPDTHIRPSRSKGSMRLDDWVLCRIKQKGNMSKNSWELPQSPTTKGLGGDVVVVPDHHVKELPSVLYTTSPQNHNSSEACSKYFLSKDCHLLAKLLATQDFPAMEADNNTTATSQSSIVTGCNSTGYDQHGTIKDDLVNNPLFVGTFNQQGKRSDARHDHESSPPSKRAMIHPRKNESIFTGTVTTTNGGAFFNNQHQSNGDMCKLNLSSAMMNLQELDVYTFAQRFLQ